MIADIIANSTFMALALLGFGFEIANRVYKDENVDLSMTFYIIFLCYILDSHTAKGCLHCVFLVTLTFLCFNSVLYINFYKKQPKIN